MGIGLLESIYSRCLAHELELQGCAVKREQVVNIEYKGVRFDEKLRFDLLVNDCLMLELKVMEGSIRLEHKLQTLSYMKLLNVPIGLVMNFGERRFGSRGIQRVILKGAGIEIN